MVTVAIVQARMGSSRLPGKVLEDLGGRPVIAHVVARAEAIKGVDVVILATSTASKDDALAEWAERQGVAYVRGSEADVLSRFVQAAQATAADIIVRITADCPILDPVVASRVVAARNGADYCTNAVQRTYPDGLDVCVFTREALQAADKEATSPHHREHVVDYFIDHPKRFRTVHVRQEADRKSMRWTLDYPEDLAFLRAVVERLGPGTWGQEEVLELLQAEPELAAMNAHRSDL